jgi:hypothetical protein
VKLAREPPERGHHFNKTEIIPAENISRLIHSIRDQRVILDSDLAKLYGVQTFRLNEAVKRNRERFPEDFLFQLTPEERDALTSQIAMSKPGRGGRRRLSHRSASPSVTSGRGPEWEVPGTLMEPQPWNPNGTTPSNASTKNSRVDRLKRSPMALSVLRSPREVEANGKVEQRGKGKGASGKFGKWAPKAPSPTNKAKANRSLPHLLTLLALLEPPSPRLLRQQPGRFP